MRVMVRISEISQVRYYTKGFTDYLRIVYTDNTQSAWSVNHYEESRTQRERCEQLQEAYNIISSAISAGKDFVEFNVDD